MNETGLDPAAVDAAARLVADADPRARAWASTAATRASGRPTRAMRGSDWADPAHFDADPELAWGSYGHRLGLYRATVPHAGFGIPHSWGERLQRDLQVFTSNVDGQFQGFDRVAKAHCLIHHLQCLRPCSDDVWPADGIKVGVDDTAMRAVRGVYLPLNGRAGLPARCSSRSEDIERRGPRLDAEARFLGSATSYTP
jgi:hypothetical protein